MSHFVLINQLQWSCLSTAAFRPSEIAQKSSDLARCGSPTRQGRVNAGQSVSPVAAPANKHMA